MQWPARLSPLLLVAAAPYEATGIASYYSHEFRGSRTASGERFDPEAMTAAHRTLPLGSWADVTSLESGVTVRVRINDRGPWRSARVVDVSLAAARKLGLIARGTHRVRIRAVGGVTQPVEPVAAGAQYFVQLASFSARERAEALAARHGAKVHRADGHWRVRLGPFAEARGADVALAKLAASGYPDAILTR